MPDFHWTAFRGEKRIAGGAPGDVVTAIKAGDADGVLVFEDTTARVIDLDLRGSLEECLARLPGGDRDLTAPAERRPGRPKLGVVPREVTLLPRHWEWLSQQPGGASVVLRKLVDAARTTAGAGSEKRKSQEAADRFMRTLAGDQAGYEEAARALYAGWRQSFVELTEDWPEDIRDHARHLAGGAFEAGQ